jgi:hypothetical protein
VVAGPVLADRIGVARREQFRAPPSETNPHPPFRCE